MVSAVSVPKNQKVSRYSNKINHLKLISILKLMLFATPVMAQKKSEFTFQWEIATEVPADSGQTSSLGIAGPVTGVFNHLFLVAGGANFPGAMPWDGGVKKYHAAGYIYCKDHRKLKVRSTVFTLPQPIAYAASCSTPEGIFYAGGENETGFSDKVWLIQFDPNGEVRFNPLPSLPVPVSNASATFVDGTVYLAGGENNTQTFTQLLALNLANKSTGWKKLADIPKPVSHSVITAAGSSSGSKIYISGGRKKNSNGISTIYASHFVYDVTANQWQEKTSLPYALCAGTGILQDQYILLFGGDKGIVFNQAETLIAAINTTSDPVKKQELILEKNILQSTHPGFSRELIAYDIDQDTWIVAGLLPYETPVTTTAVNWENGILIPSGEIRAGVRTPRILKLKIRHKK